MPTAKRVALMLASTLMLAGCAGNGAGTTTAASTRGLPRTPFGIYRVPSGSMEPTLSVGVRVTIESKTLRVGDIVVFHPPEGATEQRCGAGRQIRPGGAACATPASTEASIEFVKRIVGAPGDTIKIVKGHVIRNGQPEADSYIRPCPDISECNFPVPIKVPAGYWYLLGDNRGESDDSRFWGPVPTGWIVGVVDAATTPRL
jgi:signal peptidase I